MRRQRRAEDANGQEKALSEKRPLTGKRTARRVFFVTMLRAIATTEARAAARQGAWRAYACLASAASESDSRLETFTAMSLVGLRGHKQPTQIGRNPGGLGG